METVSNPLLRVGAMDKIAQMAKSANVPLIVDNTFATPLLVRPLELGASIVIHSATKYMAGHGDVLGGVIVADNEYCGTIRTLSRTMGPVMSPFEAYLTMRGIKTMGLRVERQCSKRLQGSQVGSRRTRESTASTSPATRRIPTLRPLPVCSPRISTAR